MVSVCFPIANHLRDHDTDQLLRVNHGNGSQSCARRSLLFNSSTPMIHSSLSDEKSLSSQLNGKLIGFNYGKYIMAQNDFS